MARTGCEQAIETALETGCTDAAAVQHLLHATGSEPYAVCEAIDIGSLERYQRPLPVMNEYDQLLGSRRRSMSSQLAQLQEATIKQHCKALRMPMMASQFSTLAEQAVREKKTHTGYLEALLTAEIEERERNTIERRIKEAHLPRVKTLEEFDFTPVAAGHGGEDARPGRGRLHRARRTGSCSSAIAGPARRIF